MAAVDGRLNAKFRQKRGVSVGVYDLGYADLATDGTIVAALPAGSIITKVVLIEKTAANAGATFDLNVGSTAIVNEGALDSSNSATVILADLATGGNLVIKNGATASSAGTFRFIVEYVEYNKTTGEYTN